MTLEAIKNGCSVMVSGSKGSQLFVFDDEPSALALYQRVKHINAELHSLGFLGDVNSIRDAAFRAANEDILNLV